MSVVPGGLKAHRAFGFTVKEAIQVFDHKGIRNICVVQSTVNETWGHDEYRGCFDSGHSVTWQYYESLTYQRNLW